MRHLILISLLFLAACGQPNDGTRNETPHSFFQDWGYFWQMPLDFEGVQSGVIETQTWPIISTTEGYDYGKVLFVCSIERTLVGDAQSGVITYENGRQVSGDGYTTQCEGKNGVYTYQVVDGGMTFGRQNQQQIFWEL